MSLDATTMAILAIAATVMVTRVSGYVIGLWIKDIGRWQDVIEILPGCAIMALIAPAILRSSLIEIIALVLTVAAMWKTGSVVLASVLGLGILILSGSG